MWGLLAKPQLGPHSRRCTLGHRLHQQLGTNHFRASDRCPKTIQIGSQPSNPEKLQEGRARPSLNEAGRPGRGPLDLFPEK